MDDMISFCKSCLKQSCMLYLFFAESSTDEMLQVVFYLLCEYFPLPNVPGLTVFLISGLSSITDTVQ